MIVATVSMFLALQGSPAPVLQHISAFKDVETCTKAIAQVILEEKEHPVEPILGDKLVCVTVLFDNKDLDDAPKEPETPKVVCRSKKFFGREVACGKVA